MTNYRGRLRPSMVSPPHWGALLKLCGPSRLPESLGVGDGLCELFFWEQGSKRRHDFYLAQVFEVYSLS